MDLLLPPGSLLHQRYEVNALISDQGGMARVYRVKDVQDSPASTWALKELRPVFSPEDQERRRQLFDQEAELLRRLKHRNVPSFRDRFDERGRSYLVLELVEGLALDQLLAQRARPLAEREVLALALQLCQALDYLHHLSPPIIYRDLKPGNLLLAHDGTVKVIDFGIARTYKAGQAHDTQLMGTEAYAAPEQYGSEQSDARTDVYALGATMYHLLTNRLPLHARLPGSSPPAHQLNAAVSQGTSDLVVRAMRKSRGRRFQTAADMGQAVRQRLAAINGSLRPQVQAALRVVLPYGADWEMPLPAQEPLIVGSGADVEGAGPHLDLSFYDAEGFVSRRHARIRPNEGLYLITDLASTNGTLVNGRRLEPNVPQVLQHGDRIQAGQVILEFAVQS